MDSLTNHKEQAEQFLRKTKVSFKAEYLKYDIHFEGDKNKRDIYQITLTRGERNFRFTFGQSINASGTHWLYGDDKKGVARLVRSNNPKIITKALLILSLASFYEGSEGAVGQKIPLCHDWDKNPNFAEPCAYDVLACLTKYDPETFADFCSNYGYEEDSRTAERIYKAVCEEYKGVCSIFTEKEMHELREIQ